MTLPPPPGSPFPDIWGRSIDPSEDPSDALGRPFHDRMFEERIVFLNGFLDDALATRVAMELMTLDANGDEPVRVHADCMGGTLEAAFAVMDVLDTMGVETEALCVGQVAGVAVGVLAVCGRRLALPHSRVWMREPSIDVYGRADDMARAAEHHRERVRLFRVRLSEASGKPVGEIEADMQRGRCLDALQAMDYGLVDEVLAPRARVIDFPRRMGFRPS